MADQDIKMLIERIMAEARTHQSARFSNEVYADEPILKTGRQMQTSTAKCVRYRVGKKTPRVARDVGFRKPSFSTAKAC